MKSAVREQRPIPLFYQYTILLPVELHGNGSPLGFADQYSFSLHRL